MVELIFAVYILLESPGTQYLLGTPPAIVKTTAVQANTENIITSHIEVNSYTAMIAISDTHVMRTNYNFLAVHPIPTPFHSLIC